MENVKHRVVILSFIFMFLSSAVTITSSYAEQIVKPTDKGHVNVGFSTEPDNPRPGNQTLLNVNFIKLQGDVQHHIDYTISVLQGGNVSRKFHSHTDEGSVSIPYQFQNSGMYQIIVEVDGVLYQPVPPEIASFTVGVGPTVPEFPTSIAMTFLSSFISVILLSSRMKFRRHFK